MSDDLSAFAKNYPTALIEVTYKTGRGGTWLASGAAATVRPDWIHSWRVIGQAVVPVPVPVATTIAGTVVPAEGL